MCSLYLGENLISGNKPINLGVRNIGEIVASSLPLTDAGLHLLDGSLILGGGIYQGFVDYIADLYTANPSANYWTTEALWQQSVNTYGVCGKFVYDSVNNTVRLPKITGIIEGTTDVSALGDLVEAGLPNITGGVGFGDTYNGTAIVGTVSGSFAQGASATRPYSPATATGTSIWSFDFDASRSSSIYGNSSTVQPQTIKAFYYIVIATNTKTEIEVDIDEVATDLNGKADTDLTNVTDTGYIQMARAGMPSSRYIDLTLGASGTEYTAPTNGYVLVGKQSNGANQNIHTYIDGYPREISWVNSGCNGFVCTPVYKGQKFKIYYTTGGSTQVFRFYYAQGSESEAS